MKLFKRKKKAKSNIGVMLSDNGCADMLKVAGYTTLDRSPEIMTGCRRIAEIIGSITIHLMENTGSGDVRIVNALSRKIDIHPCNGMTRKTWIEAIVMNLLLHGDGNSIVRVHTRRGILEDLEPIPAFRVAFDDSQQKIRIDGTAYADDEVLHFVLHPDPLALWRGCGLSVSLRDVTHNLRQAAETERAFLSSKWKPSVIVKVDALTEEFSNPEGRQKLLDSYVKSSSVGEPWLIPAEQFQVDTVRPLSLADLAISDSIELNRRMVAAILGVPPFILGIGEYDKDAWNAFVNYTVKPIVTGLQQEMTRKLIFSEKMYIKFNIFSLLDWDISTISSVFSTLADRGIVTGNEVRDRLGMSPLDGLDELRILENYIPFDMSAMQKKLIQ